MMEWKNARSLLACTTAALALLWAAPGTFAWAAPENGEVTRGSADIKTDGAATTIRQSSDRAVVRWDRYDVNKDETVLYSQPSASSITLNRILDSSASRIDGRIEANGRVILMNPNGILFGQTSRVDVAGLVATTGHIEDSAFMEGKERLAVAEGENPEGFVINKGRITAREAGLVGLVAPHAENSGLIEARLGRVTLAGTDRVTLDLAGDDLIHLDAGTEIGGAVKNSGTIRADGGRIVLTAEQARSAMEGAIVNTGVLEARTAEMKNGQIVLRAVRTPASFPALAPAPAIRNAGHLNAGGKEKGESGGAIDILGSVVTR